MDGFLDILIPLRSWNILLMSEYGHLATPPPLPCTPHGLWMPYKKNCNNRSVRQRVQEKMQLGQKSLVKNDKNVNNLFLVRLVGFPKIHLTATKNAFLWAHQKNSFFQLIVFMVEFPPLLFFNGVRCTGEIKVSFS